MGIYNFDGAIDSDWTWQTFGRELILSGDLDPLYIMLAEAQPIMGDAMLKRWLLAYSCYYHTGVASIIAEAPSDEFYHGENGMWAGIENRWPRGMERRYFWGKQAENCINDLEERERCPESIIDHIVGGAGRLFKDVSERTQELVGFGPWMGWKMSDLVDRVLCEPVDFSDSIWGMVPDPVKGTAMVMFGDWRHPITPEQTQEVVGNIVDEFDDLLAPPYYDRPINIQEAETILCNIKAHHKRFYPMGNDTYHMMNALDGWGDLAQELRRWIPEVQQRWLDEEGKIKFVSYEEYYEEVLPTLL